MMKKWHLLEERISFHWRSRNWIKRRIKEIKHQILLIPKEENITAPVASHQLPSPGWYTKKFYQIWTRIYKIKERTTTPWCNNVQSSCRTTCKTVICRTRSINCYQHATGHNEKLYITIKPQQIASINKVPTKSRLHRVYSSSAKNFVQP